MASVLLSLLSPLLSVPFWSRCNGPLLRGSNLLQVLLHERGICNTRCDDIFDAIDPNRKICWVSLDLCFARRRHKRESWKHNRLRTSDAKKKRRTAFPQTTRITFRIAFVLQPFHISHSPDQLIVAALTNSGQSHQDRTSPHPLQRLFPPRTCQCRNQMSVINARSSPTKERKGRTGHCNPPPADSRSPSDQAVPTLPSSPRLVMSNEPRRAIVVTDPDPGVPMPARLADGDSEDDGNKDSYKEDKPAAIIVRSGWWSDDAMSYGSKSQRCMAT